MPPAPFIRALVFCCLFTGIFYTVYAQDTVAVKAGNNHLSIAERFFARSKPDSAFTALISARNAFNKARHKPGIQMANKLMADFYSRNGLDSIALGIYKALPGLNNGDSLSAVIHSSLAALYFKKKDYKSALKSDSIALNIYTVLGIRKKIANTYLHIAAIRQEQQRFREAEYILLRKALPAYSSAGDIAGRCATFSALGKTYLVLSRTSEAKWFYIQASMAAEKLKDPRAISLSFIGLGNVKMQIGDDHLALGDYAAADKLASDNALYSTAALANAGLARLYTKMGEAALAEKSHTRSRFLTGLENERNRRMITLAIRLKNTTEEKITVSKAAKVVAKLAKHAPQLFLLFVILSSFALFLILFIKFNRNRN